MSPSTVIISRPWAAASDSARAVSASAHASTLKVSNAAASSAYAFAITPQPQPDRRDRLDKLERRGAVDETSALAPVVVEAELKPEVMRPAGDRLGACHDPPRLVAALRRVDPAEGDPVRPEHAKLL